MIVSDSVCTVKYCSYFIMAFPRSQRFVEKESSTPAPTAYQLPSALVENHCSAWVKPCTFDHQCGQCFDASNSHDYSGQSNKSREASHIPCCNRARDCASSGARDNKENLCGIQRKDGSNIPKFKKNISPKLTEPKAPSFMTRPRHNTHNCFSTGTEDADTPPSISNFNRHSLKRKSMKLIKQNKAKSAETINDSTLPSKLRIKSDKSDFEETRQLSTSFTGTNDKSSDHIVDSKGASEASASSGRGTTLKRQRNITDDMKGSELAQNLSTNSTEDSTICVDNQDNFSLNVSESSEKVILEKDNSLQKEYFANLNDTDISHESEALEDAAPDNIMLFSEFVEEAAKMFKKEFENAFKIKSRSRKETKVLKSLDLTPTVDKHVVFLVTDEFIDDEYDSYMKDVTLDKLRKMEDIELFQIFKSLIHIYMQRRAVNKPKQKVLFKRKQKLPRKVRRNIRCDVGKPSTRKNIGRNKKRICNEIEKIVRNAISDLKEEFKNEIYRRTEEKVDLLMTKLAKVLLKADESIEEKCERSTADLINKFYKIINL